MRTALLFLLLAFSAPAAEHPCPAAKAAGEHLHDLTTSYDGSDSVAHLQTIRGQMSAAERELFRLPPMEDIRAGKTGFLSLGEGDSDIISGLISDRKARGLPFEDLIGVDFAYWNREEVVNHAGTDKETRRPYEKAFVKQHPENYVAQSFANLDLKDANGAPRKFGHMMSTMSLVFVLRKSSPEAGKEIFRHLARHAEKGATLWVDGGGATKAEMLKLKSLLAELKSEGTIAAYSASTLQVEEGVMVAPPLLYQDEFAVKFP